MRGLRVWMAAAAALALACGDDGGGDSSGESGSEETTDTSASTTTGSPTATTSGEEESSSASTDPSTTGDTTSGEESTTGGATSGDFSLLTYNVAGLPQGISQSNPIENMPQISPLLNLYDLALVQEDFAYHDLLEADAEHPYQSEPTGMMGVNYGDGLNRFSIFPFDDFMRETWEECNGVFDQANDCLTDKGFSVGLHTLAPGAEIDVYNLHMDAGGSSGDEAARLAQTMQLLDEISTRSPGRAVIVAGDTNMDEEDEATLQILLQGAELEDACRVLQCGEDARIDRVMYRGSDAVLLEATSWIVDPNFVDQNGEDLSDHEAIGVELHWELQ